MKYKYAYTGEETVFLPIQGVELKKGDSIESDEPLNHPKLQENTVQTTAPKDAK